MLDAPAVGLAGVWWCGDPPAGHGTAFLVAHRKCFRAALDDPENFFDIGGINGFPVPYTHV